MVEDERVARNGAVAPQADLRGELDRRALIPREPHSQPRREVGDARTREHRVGPDRGDASCEMAGPERCRPFPGVGRRVEIRRERGHVSSPRVGRGALHQLGPAVGSEPFEVLVLGGRLEHPPPDPVVVVVGSGRGACRHPEVVVLAVAVDREIPRVQTTGMGSERRLTDRQHPVSRDSHQMGPSSEIVDDALDGDDRTAPRRERAPHPFEERRVHRHVTGAIGHRRVQQRHIGNERREQPDLTEGSVHACVGVVGLHGGPDDRSCDDRRETAGGGLQAL